MRTKYGKQHEPHTPVPFTTMASNDSHIAVMNLCRSSIYRTWLVVFLAFISKVASLSSQPSLMVVPMYRSGPSRSLLPSYTDFMTDRKVVIREITWGEKGLLPLHIYSGAMLKQDRCRPSLELSEKSNSVMSKSAEHLLSHQESLTQEAQNRLASKLQAEARASRQLSPEEHLHILYADAHICVVHKPSGVLCVPGPRRNPSVANLVHDVLQPTIPVDQTVVHRLDMDTSGVVCFAQTGDALRQLHRDFRDRERVQKTYQALVCGHVVTSEGEIDLPLERDPTRPPFMRVALLGGRDDEDENMNRNFGAFAKHIDKAPKSSLTTFRVLSREYIADGLPVTRLELKPYTGRTHQLRVHCAAIGHPIVGDDIYGFGGEGSMDGGLLDDQRNLFLDRSSLDLQNRLFLESKINLCLHARRLCINHPFTEAPMVFEVDPNF